MKMSRIKDCYYNFLIKFVVSWSKDRLIFRLVSATFYVTKYVISLINASANF